MGSKQNNKTEMPSGNQEMCSNRNKTQRKRQYSTQSHDTEISCMSQETATTSVSSGTDSDMSMSKRSCDRSVSFCLANENEDDHYSDSEARNCCTDNAFNSGIDLSPRPNDSAYHVCNSISMETGQDAMSRRMSSLQVNQSRGCCHSSFSEESCKQPLLRRQSTLSRGIVNEHPINSENEARYPSICNFDHNQCQKLCSSVKVLKRIVFVLCVCNIVLLVALIVVPTLYVLYIQASKEPPPVTGQLQSTSEQQRHTPYCVDCESLIKNIPTFIKTQAILKSIGENGKCCISDPGTLMTIINQISQEAIERAKGSVCTSCPFGSSENIITPAVHLKSQGNGLINVTKVFNKKPMESTHLVGWKSSFARDHQGLWGQLNENGTSIRVKSTGMYFIYAMIRHKGCVLNNFGCDSMHTTPLSSPLAPLKVALYICPHGINNDHSSCSISAMGQNHYSSENGTQQNTYFGRLFYLKENENLYLGISGDAFLHLESESHYMGFYKV